MNVSSFHRHAVLTAIMLCAAFIAPTTTVLAQHASATADHATAAVNHDDIVAHVQGMLQIVYDQVGATDAQKTQLDAIVRQASADLAPLQQKLRASHTQMFSLLTRDTIDRAALESVRVAQSSDDERLSKRMSQFFLDVAETLTAAQRKALADRLPQHAG